MSQGQGFRGQDTLWTILPKIWLAELSRGFRESHSWSSTNSTLETMRYGLMLTNSPILVRITDRHVQWIVLLCYWDELARYNYAFASWAWSTVVYCLYLLSIAMTKLRKSTPGTFYSFLSLSLFQFLNLFYRDLPSFSRLIESLFSSGTPGLDSTNFPFRHPSYNKMLIRI